MNEPLSKAIAILGRQSVLANILGVAQGMVSHWLNKAKKGVPAEYCLAIEQATNGQVTREQLRPDIFTPSVSIPSTVTQAKRKAHKKEWLTKKNVVDDSRGAGNV